MTEPEVSIRLALYYISNNLTDEDVKISLDGAHIRTGNAEHFPINSFLKEVHCTKEYGDNDKWQGIYKVSGHNQRIELFSAPGVGDVVVQLKDGKKVYIESKKGKTNKSNQEYSLMREAIGQLMTGTELTDEIIPMVAVPFSVKSYELANRWVALTQMKKIGIRFALVHENGSIDFI